jgi:hypothetical protein
MGVGAARVMEPHVLSSGKQITSSMCTVTLAYWCRLIFSRNVLKVNF